MAKPRRTSVLGSVGFSVIELLVVVALVGVGAAVAIPQWYRYRQNALQMEAKTILTSIHVSEQLYHTDSGTFTACIDLLGVVNSNDKRYYIAGFDATSLGNNCGKFGNQTCRGYRWQYNGSAMGGAGTCAPTETYVSETPNSRATRFARFPGPADLQTVASELTKSAYLARATGQVARANSTYDQWTIDQNRVLLHREVIIN